MALRAEYVYGLLQTLALSEKEQLRPGDPLLIGTEDAE